MPAVRAPREVIAPLTKMLRRNGLPHARVMAGAGTYMNAGHGYNNMYDDMTALTVVTLTKTILYSSGLSFMGKRSTGGWRACWSTVDGELRFIWNRATTGLDFRTNNAAATNVNQWYWMAMAYAQSGPVGPFIYVGDLSVPFRSCTFGTATAGSGAFSTDVTQTLTLGTENTGGANQPWNGAIALLMLFNRVLTRAELVRIQFDPWLALSMRGCIGFWIPGMDAPGNVIDWSGWGSHATQSASGHKVRRGPGIIQRRGRISYVPVSGNVTGSGALVISSLVLASSGKERMIGSSVLNASSLMLASTGKERMLGAAAMALNSLVLASTGKERMIGSAAVALQPLQLSSSGLERIIGTAALVMARGSIASTGTETIIGVAGAAALTMVSTVLAAIGIVVNPIIATFGGKYAREHARALRDIGAAEAASYARQHAQALKDISKAEAASYARQHAQALKDISKAGL